MNVIQLREFLTLQKMEQAEKDLDRNVNGLTYDSRKVREGLVFFAIAGEKLDGHHYIADAITRGAAAVVMVRKDAPKGATFVRVKDARRAMGLWAAHF